MLIELNILELTLLRRILKARLENRMCEPELAITLQAMLAEIEAVLATLGHCGGLRARQSQFCLQTRHEPSSKVSFPVRVLGMAHSSNPTVTLQLTPLEALALWECVHIYSQSASEDDRTECDKLETKLRSANSSWFSEQGAEQAMVP